MHLVRAAIASFGQTPTSAAFRQELQKAALCEAWRFPFHGIELHTCLRILQVYVRKHYTLYLQSIWATTGSSTLTIMVANRA